MSESHAFSGEEEISWFWEGMESEARGTLSPEQRIAIEEALKKSAGPTRPADLRFYLGGYFIRVIAGKERRNKKRQRRDLKNNPLFSAKNAPVLVIFGLLWVPSSLYIAAFLTKVISHLFL